MWNDIKSYIESLGVSPKFQLTDKFNQYYTPPLNIKKIETIDGFTYYDYQEETIKEFVKNGRGISLLPTASGKGLCIAGLCKTILTNHPTYKILLVVPNVLLLNQLHDSFIEEFNIDNISIWGDKKLPDWSKNIIIANSQILVSDIKKTLTKVQHFNAIIVDEVHTIGTKKNKINKIIQNINTNIKFGVTGTLPSDLLATWNTVGKIGPILYEKTSHQIRQQGSISEVEIKIVNFSHKGAPSTPDPSDVRPTAKYEKEIDFIFNDTKRNNFIGDLANKIKGNVLILTDRIFHGELLVKTLSSSSKSVHFIQGSTESDARTEIRRVMEESDNVICIAMSKIFSVGVSIKNLKYVIFCNIGKSNVKIMQSIGRSLRLHKNKDKAIIFDLCDKLKYSMDHLRERTQLYTKEKMKFKTTNINL